MKKIFALLAVIGILTFGVSKAINAQDVEAEGAADVNKVEQADTVPAQQQTAAGEGNPFINRLNRNSLKVEPDLWDSSS